MTTTTDAPAPRRWSALVVLSLAQLMVVLGDSVVNISLPQAARALHISDASRSWAVTSYVLCFGGLLLLAGRIADTIGRRRALLIGLAGFAAASATGGAAQNATGYFSARAVQGAFAAVLTPAALALVAVMFRDDRERSRAFGAVFLFLAYYLQQTLGLSPLTSGLAFLPLSAALVTTSVLGAPLSHRAGPRNALLLGTAVATAGLLTLGFLSPTSTYRSSVLIAELLIGVGMGFVFLSQPTLVMKVVPHGDLGTASALLNTAQQVGGAVGTALLNTVYASAAAALAGSALLASLHGYRVTFLVSAALLVAAFVLTSALPTRRALHSANHEATA